MSKAAELAALIGSQTALSNRNLVINGAMQVAQRGTSTTGSSSNNAFPACDRWKVGFTSGGTYDFSQSTDAPDGFSSSIKVKCASTDTSIASGDEFIVQHRIEAQNLQQLAYGTSAAKNITLSFYAKAVNKTGTYCVHIQKNDSTKAYIYKEYTLTTDWQRFELTFPANSVVQASGGAIANDNGIGLIIMFILMNGSSTQGTDAKDQWSATNHRSSSSQVNFMDSTSNEWYLTGVQLEVGEQATPFEHRSFGDELRRCQRYFYFLNLGGTYQVGGGLPGMLYSTDLAFATIPFMCEMRAAPSITPSNANTWQFINASDSPHQCQTVAGYASSKYSATITLDPSSSSSTPNVSETGGGILWPGNANSNDATVSLAAEL